MRTIYNATILVRKKSFPSLVDELYRRECELMELQHIEETEGGRLYSLVIGAPSAKRFNDLVTIIESAGDRFRVISVKNVIEERVVGGLISVTGKIPMETAADFEISLRAAEDLIVSRSAEKDGLAYTGISRNVALVTGLNAAEEGGGERLVRAQARAERDALIMARFAGLNGVPLNVCFDHPEDLVKVLKRLERSFAAIRIMRIDEASLMLYDLLHGEISIPLVSEEHDDLPLLLLAIIIRMMLKYRMKPEETTVGFAGIDCSAVRLTRVLHRIGLRRVLGADSTEKAMLALEDEGGLATTTENIFTNADITVIVKEFFDTQEYRAIRPGQLVISLLEDEDAVAEIIADKGVRELVRRDPARLAALVPGMVKGIIAAGIPSITDARLVEYAKKCASLLNTSFDFPALFGEIHDQICAIAMAGASKG